MQLVQWRANRVRGSATLVRSRLSDTAMGFIWAVWLGGIALGLGLVLLYANKPGRPADRFSRLPVAYASERIERQPRLVAFLHPHCPCSQATIAELARLMPALRNRVKVDVFFLQPNGRPDHWVEGRTWKSAQAIPGIQVHRDPDGKTASLFKAYTSGQAYLFDSSGKLVFVGGITPSRGHEGDNAGRDIILAWLKRELPQGVVRTSRVFGCALQEKDL